MFIYLLILYDSIYFVNNSKHSCFSAQHKWVKRMAATLSSQYAPSRMGVGECWAGRGGGWEVDRATAVYTSSLGMFSTNIFYF